MTIRLNETRSLKKIIMKINKAYIKIVVYKLTQEEKFLRKYVLTKEYDKGVIYHRPFLTSM
jgi:hypothetical protein